MHMFIHVCFLKSAACVTAERQFLIKSRNSLASVSIAFFSFFMLLPPENSLQLEGMDLQWTSYTGVFQRGSRTEKGKKTQPRQFIQVGKSRIPLYFGLIYQNFTVMKSISVEFAVIIF